MFPYPEIGSITISGKLIREDGTEFNPSIDELFESCNPTKNIITIIAPKKGNVIRRKVYKRKIRSKTNKRKRKPKYQNTLRSSLMFLVPSRDPTKVRDHFYVIKLFNKGVINVTGLRKLNDKYFLRTMNRFLLFLKKYVGKLIYVEDDMPSNINFKFKINAKCLFDRSSIYNILENSLFTPADQSTIKQMVSDFVLTQTVEWYESSKPTIRYDSEYLGSLLTELKIPVFQNTKFDQVYKNTFISFNTNIIYAKLLVHSANRLFELKKRTTEFKAVRLILHTADGLRTLKVSIFYRGKINSTGKTLEDGQYVLDYLNNIFENHYNDFIENDSESDLELDFD